MKTDYMRNNNSTVILVADSHKHFPGTDISVEVNVEPLATTINVFNETEITTSENLEPFTTVNMFEKSGLSATDPSGHQVFHGNVLVAVLFSVVITVAASVAVCVITIYCVRRLKQKEHQSEQPNDTISFQPIAQQERVIYPPSEQNSHTLQNILSSTSSFQEEQPLLIQRCQTPEILIVSEAPPAYDEGLFHGSIEQEVLIQGCCAPEIPSFSKSPPSYDEVLIKGFQAPEVPVYSDAPPSYDELKV